MNVITRAQRAVLLAALAAPNFLARPLAAQAPAAVGHTIPVPAALAARRSSAVVLDGKLDDSAWQSATPITEFTQSDPEEGKPASQRTEVRFLFDDEALWRSVASSRAPCTGTSRSKAHRGRAHSSR